ncbi:hypothetical protein KPL71_012031 [Citrus sinensis]|uniref:Uncharacterized protein n=1 Tax=Citrus sinensis TaxID=2711 RepID=A0ACB8L8A7_CITSI|nr:hypothetical protein KPL71_012031 [Citrus sinensis]
MASTSSTPPVTLSSTLSLPRSCTSHTTNKIENLVEYSYIPESAQISESSYPLLSPYHLYKRPSSFTRSIHTLISTRRPHPKEYIQSSCLNQCSLQATPAEQYVTLKIPSELISNWKREGYTHLYLGGIRLILTLHGRKGLPVTARLAMLDTRFKQYQDAVIGTVLTTLHAGSVLLTFYPNFNLSLQDPNLPTTLKVQVQIQAPIQTSDSMFERRQDGTVRMTFKPPPSAPQEPPRLSFTYSSMITAVQTAEEDLPITGFNSEGYPVYPAKHNGHFLWDAPGSEPHTDSHRNVVSKPFIPSPITSTGYLEPPKPFESVLNWQTQNARAQNDTLLNINSKVENTSLRTEQLETKVDFISAQMQQIHQNLQSRITQLDSELRAMLAQRYYDSEFDQKEREIRRLKAELAQIESDKQRPTLFTTSPPIPSIGPTYHPFAFMLSPIRQYDPSKLFCMTHTLFRDNPLPPPPKPKPKLRPQPRPVTFHIPGQHSPGHTPASPPVSSPPTESQPPSQSKDKIPMHQFISTSDSEKSYADITRILMAQPDQPPPGQTSHTEPYVDIPSEVEEEMPESSATNQPPPAQAHTSSPSQKSSNGPWFTFDDLPSHKWRDRLNEMSAWIDLQMLRPGTTTQSVLREFATRFTGALRDWFDSLGNYRQLQFVQLPKVSSALAVIHDQFLGDPSALAKTCLDKLCEQKQFFKELLKDKEPFRSACKKPYLQIKCKQKKDCDCSPKKKRYFKKFRNPEFSSRSRRSRKPYRFFRKKSSSSRDFKRRKSSRCFICKRKGHFAKDCPHKREKSIRLVEHLQTTTDYSLEKDELEFYFSEQDEPNDETMFALQNSSDDSDSDQSQIIFHQQLLSLDTTIPIPSIKLQILPSKFQRPIPAIGLIDTSAQRSMLNPHLLPPEYWTNYEEHFKAVNGKLFTTSLITKKPIGIQIFPNCVIWTKVIGSTLPNKDLLLGFDILHQIKHLQILPNGIRVKSMFKPFTDILKLYNLSETPQPYQDISNKLLSFCPESHSEFTHPNPLWKNKSFFIKLPFKLNEDINPTKATHPVGDPFKRHKLDELMTGNLSWDLDYGWDLKKFVQHLEFGLEPLRLWASWDLGEKGIKHSKASGNRGCLERTLIQARRLDIFFRVRAAGGYESTDTAGQPSPASTPTSPPAPLSVPTQSKDKEPMHQFTAHTVTHSSLTVDQTSDSNPAVSDSPTETDTESSESTSDSEKSYADITKILMAQPDQPTQGQTSHTEPYVDIPSEVEEEMPESSATNQPPPTQTHPSSQKSSNGPWFTFDDLPSHKWRQYRQLQFVDLPEVSSALAVLHDQFLGDPSAVFEAARRDYLNMKCCSLNAKDLDFHYKRMSLLFYKLNGFNEPTLKHVFLASLPEELQPNIQRQLKK